MLTIIHKVGTNRPDMEILDRNEELVARLEFEVCRATPHYDDHYQWRVRLIHIDDGSDSTFTSVKAAEYYVLAMYIEDENTRKLYKESEAN